MTRSISVLLAFVILAAIPAARADVLADARAHVHRGMELYKDRRWQEAMEEFQAAYRLKPHGALHFNVAQCRERLDDGPGALRSYHDYLREVPGATDRDAVRAGMKRLEEKLAEAHLHVLLLDSSPSGARVEIDGVERGITPFHGVLAPGAHALALTLPEHARWAEQLEVSEAAAVIRDVTLRPAAGEAASAATSDLGAHPPAATPPPAPPRSEAPTPARTGRLLPAWVAAGAAALLATVGAVYGASARSDARAIDRLPAPDGAAATAKARSARANARTANVLYGAAAGAAGLSAMFVVLEF